MSTLLNQAQYAKHRGVSKMAISKLVKQGLITIKNGKIDPVKADKELKANLHPSHVKSSPENGKKGGRPKGIHTPRTPSQPSAPSEQPQNPGASFASSRAAKEFIKAKMLKNELDIQNGKLVDAEEVLFALKDLHLEIRNGIRAIPAKATGEIMNIIASGSPNIATQVQAVLRRETDETLESLSKWTLPTYAKKR